MPRGGALTAAAGRVSKSVLLETRSESAGASCRAAGLSGGEAEFGGDAVQGLERRGRGERQAAGAAPVPRRAGGDPKIPRMARI